MKKRNNKKNIDKAIKKNNKKKKKKNKQEQYETCYTFSVYNFIIKWLFSKRQTQGWFQY